MSGNLVDLATMDLPSDRVHLTHGGDATLTRRLPDDLAEAARGYARSHGVSYCALWQAALVTVRHRYTGETDLAIRSGDAVRHADLSGNPGFAELARAAHAWRSYNGNVGAHGLASLCRELEDRARNGKIATARELLGELRALHTRVREELQFEMRRSA